MLPSKNAGKLRGFFTGHDVSVVMDKSFATGEKRYIPKVGGKRLRLSWKTRQHAEVYGDAVASRCKRMAELINKQLRERKENVHV